MESLGLLRAEWNVKPSVHRLPNFSFRFETYKLHEIALTISPPKPLRFLRRNYCDRPPTHHARKQRVEDAMSIEEEVIDRNQLRFAESHEINTARRGKRIEFMWGRHRSRC